MTSIAIYGLAAVFEIGGCFAVWAWARQDASSLWLLPGLAGLIGFAWLLTRVDVEHAGRAYAVYGGIYICASLAWLWAFEGVRPDRWDVIGGAVSILGALLILYGPRPA